MKISIRWLSHPYEAWEAAFVTQGKVPRKNIPIESWKGLVRAEHSPIRSAILRIKMENISYYSSVHLARHSHSLHFVKSNRPDIAGKERSIHDTVTHLMDCNVQALLSIGRARLCYKASEETREIVENIVLKLYQGDEYMKVVANNMMPNCEYRGFCPEMKPCGRKGSK